MKTSLLISGLFLLISAQSFPHIIKKIEKNDSSFEIIKLPIERWQEYKQFRIESTQEIDRPGIESAEEIMAKKDQEWKDFLAKADEEKQFVVFFAQANNKLVGIAGAELGQLAHIKHRAFLFSIHVLPEYRKYEIGRMLVETLLAHLKDKGVVTVLGITMSEKGMNLYKEYGFKFMGIYEKSMYANGTYYDGYYMTKLLN